MKEYFYANDVDRFFTSMPRSIKVIVNHRLAEFSCMSRPRSTVQSNIHILHRGTSLADLLATRPFGLVEAETWAILCQCVQALQDLFLADGLSGRQCTPLVTPSTLMLSSKGRVKLCLNYSFLASGPPAHLAGYLAPEYKVNKTYSDTEFEKMWIFSLGETLSRASVVSRSAISRLSNELAQVLADMTRLQSAARASLMHLLNVMSGYCKKRVQNRPFSHIVMDLHQEALAGVEAAIDTPWGPPAMPELVPQHKTRSECPLGSGPRRWRLYKRHNIDMLPKTTKEAATSMEDLSMITCSNAPGKVVRPRSLCVPDTRYYQYDDNNFFPNSGSAGLDISKISMHNFEIVNEQDGCEERPNFQADRRSKRFHVRRNPVQRAASRLYRAGIDLPTNRAGLTNVCVGPEFVVRATLPTRKLVMADSKGTRKLLTVIMLDGQKLDVTCTPTRATAGQLLELIIQQEQIEENFLLGLSALIAGDFVFLPSDTRICKVLQPDNNSAVQHTLYLRVRFFLPSLRGIRGSQARHLLYLQLRRSILEHQLPCSFAQIIQLNGLALQAEFGNYDEIEHGGSRGDYFLLEHYVPETMMCIIDDQNRLREELKTAHGTKHGLEREKAEQDFIIFAQNLPHYGGHFYTAAWLLKEKEHKTVWLYISAQGINLYDRGTSTSHFGPQLYETFEWKSIQTLCYSKHYLCILPHHNGVWHRFKFKKYKLKMDFKKSYFAFRLASLHHQFFLRLRTEYTSLQSLSQHFGIPLKDIKNETNSLRKLDAALVQPIYSQLHYYDGTINADTEFKVDFTRSNSAFSQQEPETSFHRKSKSVQDLNAILYDTINEDFQNKQNENPVEMYENESVLDSRYFSGLPMGSTEKRRGVKMGTRAFSILPSRMSRSMEAVSAPGQDYLDQISLESVSLHCSSTSISKSSIERGMGGGVPSCYGEAYVLDSTIKSVSQQNFLPNFQESINETLLEKLNNMSFAEERMLSTVTIERDDHGSLGLQITEGSDGNIYVQSVIAGGAAHLTKGVVGGDQVVAVNGLSLLGRKYVDSLELLKGSRQQSGGSNDVPAETTASTVELVLSRVVSTFRQPSNGKNSISNIEHGTLAILHDLNKRNNSYLSSQVKSNSEELAERCESAISSVEKHLTESCHDHLSNATKYLNRSRVKDAFLHEKNIFHHYGPEKSSIPDAYVKIDPDYFSRTILELPNSNDRAVIVEMIPKKDNHNFHVQNKRTQYAERDNKSILERGKNKNTRLDREDDKYVKNDTVALPRSLGLSRKWKGPVRYPVTPVKKTGSSNDEIIVNTSDDEQVFI